MELIQARKEIILKSQKYYVLSKESGKMNVFQTPSYDLTQITQT